MSDEQTKQPRKRSGLLARLLKLVLCVAVLAGLGLAAGFKVQQSVTYRSEQVTCGKWVWEDPGAFVQYSRYWGEWTLARLRAIDRQVGASDKVKAGGEVIAREAKKAAHAVKEKVSEQFGEQPEAERGPSRAEIDALEREANFGYTERELEALPEGYYEALRAGHAAMKGGVDAYSQAIKDSDDAALARARAELERAREQLTEARELYPQDERPREMLTTIQEYLHQIAKDAAVDY